MDTPDDLPPLRRAARWFEASPAELAGLAILLAGALAASVVLWWSASGRPDTLPGQAAEAGTPHTGFDDAAAPAVPPAAAPGQAEPPPTPTELIVHVTGAVAAPGVVVIPAGGRAGDAVQAAGGLLADAEVAAINLARELQDGEHVHVPVVGEQAPPMDSAGAGPSAVGADGRVDLNRATVQELETLPGIGPSRADAIVRHREANGPFGVPGDLREVPGIGEVTFQRLAELVTVG